MIVEVSADDEKTLTTEGLKAATALIETSIVARVAIQSHRERVYGEVMCQWPVEYQDAAIHTMNVRGADDGS